MISKRIQDKVEAAKKLNYKLPPGVTFTKELMADGRYGYVFRHETMGQLGRILVLPLGNETQLQVEVSGDPDDPMTKVRQDILDPISRDILGKMEDICGPGTGVPGSYESPRDQHCVKSMIYPCDICETTVAHIIFADDATTSGHLEDYARMMHSRIKEIAVPTWIIGDESENIVNGEDLRKSLVLKIYPDRQPARVMTPDEVMDKINPMMENHCKK